MADEHSDELRILAAAMKTTLQGAEILTVLRANPLIHMRELDKIIPHSSVAMHRLRDRVQHLGIKIITHPRLGYSLGEGAREIMDARVAAFMGIAPAA